MIRWVAVLLLAMPLPVAAQGIVYSDVQTQSCLDTLDDGAVMDDCAGLSAGACMHANGAGHTTVGMSGCLDGEFAFWDAHLNETYQTVLSRAKETDAEMKDLGSFAPSIAEPLVAMQRAWITFRDHACDYERSLWGGGTGGGPATLRCLLELTAAQTERLSRRLGN